ncbi:MAG: hypothetical protein Q9169_005289, partial [Polycauliona sp. 2 TL-2023]
EASGVGVARNIRNDIDVLLDHNQNNISGFEVLSNISDTFDPGYLNRSFTKPQSAALIKMSKQKFEPSCSMTSIAHTAFILAMFKITHSRETVWLTVTDPAPTFVSPFFMDGRRYLDSDHPQSDDYTPVFQADALITFSNVNDLLLVPSATPSQQVRNLEKACQASVIAYTRIRERPSILLETLARADLTPKHVPGRN